VRGEYDRRAGVDEADDEVPQEPARAWVHPGRRLVLHAHTGADLGFYKGGQWRRQGGSFPPMGGRPKIM